MFIEVKNGGQKTITLSNGKTLSFLEQVTPLAPAEEVSGPGTEVQPDFNLGDIMDDEGRSGRAKVLLQEWEDAFAGRGPKIGGTNNKQHYIPQTDETPFHSRTTTVPPPPLPLLHPCRRIPCALYWGNLGCPWLVLLVFYSWPKKWVLAGSLGRGRQAEDSIFHQWPWLLGMQPHALRPEECWGHIPASNGGVSGWTSTLQVPRVLGRHDGASEQLWGPHKQPSKWFSASSAILASSWSPQSASFSTPGCSTAVVTQRNSSQLPVKGVRLRTPYPRKPEHGWRMRAINTLQLTLATVVTHKVWLEQNPRRRGTTIRKPTFAKGQVTSWLVWGRNGLVQSHTVGPKTNLVVALYWCRTHLGAMVKAGTAFSEEGVYVTRIPLPPFLSGWWRHFCCTVDRG